MRRGWVHAAAVPADLVEALSIAVSDCEMRWRDARPANDFKGLLPSMRRVLDLTREVARVKAQLLKLSPYDALLDEYEPGGSSAEIDAVFDDLARFLPGFIDAVLAKQAKEPAALPVTGPFPAEAAGAGAQADGAARLRLRPRPARHQPPPVLRRRARRRAADHALGRVRLFPPA